VRWYLLLYAVALALMLAGCVIPAVLCAGTAHCLPLRHRSLRIKPVASIDTP